jgi:adenosylcobinamide kinase/adenosylcobinamide-phosphate guanylyltransferase
LIHLITGASASGKSEYAEKKAKALGGRLIYAASMHNDASTEVLERIEKHRRQRQTYGFLTIEQETDIEKLPVTAEDTVLVECLSNLLANEMFLAGHTAETAVDKITTGLRLLSGKCRNLVIVTNEIFSDGCAYDPVTVSYIGALAQINRQAAENADCVTEVVYGLAVRIKGENK